MLAGNSRLKCNGSERDGVSRLIFVIALGLIAIKVI
jgi:hypothetical protein